MRSSRPLLGLALCLALATGFSGNAHAEGTRLAGTWYVLIHYTDTATANPDAPRWAEYVWHLAMEGSRLRWTEYPIIVLGDDSGRFERSNTGYKRVLAAWEPNDGQAAELAAGPKVNSRGSFSTTLRGSDEKGWASGKKRRSVSVSSFSYEKRWEIENALELPVFRQSDVLGSPTAEGGEGQTLYTVETEDGDEMQGSWGRDESRRGSFRMMRIGAVQGIESKGDQADVRGRINERAGITDDLEELGRDLFLGGGDSPSPPGDE